MGLLFLCFKDSGRWGEGGFNQFTPSATTVACMPSLHVGPLASAGHMPWNPSLLGIRLCANCPFTALTPSPTPTTVHPVPAEMCLSLEASPRHPKCNKLFPNL